MSSLPKSKRALKELKQLIRDPKVQSYFDYESSKVDENSKQFHIYGYLLPRTAPYKYGSYKVRIRLPEEYPFKAPDIELLTCIYHPALRQIGSTSTFCRGCYRKKWSAAFLIRHMIELHVNIIDEPEVTERYCVMDPEAKTLYDQNRAKYEEKALAMVKKYSSPRPNPSIISLKFAAKQMICKQVYFESEKINQLPLSNSLKQYLDPSLDGK